jgi:hypothetical protein
MSTLQWIGFIILLVCILGIGVAAGVAWAMYQFGKGLRF